MNKNRSFAEFTSNVVAYQKCSDRGHCNTHRLDRIGVLDRPFWRIPWLTSLWSPTTTAALAALWVTWSPWGAS